MKYSKSSPVFWLMFIIGAVALIGFSFTPAVADDGQGVLEEEQDEGFPVEIDDGGEDGYLEDRGDGSFGRNDQATWIGSADFTPYDSTTNYRYASPGMRYIVGGSPWMDAGVRLPSGAKMVLVRIYYDDNHPTQRVQFWIFKNRYNVSPFTFTTPINALASPSGISRYSSVFRNWTETIQNAQYWYQARFRTEAAVGAATKYAGVRLFWHRQIRNGLPNPFSDIGGESFDFQNSIKALAASGITVGFPDGTFRPDNFVTRGQFAAFFARALGLYWDFFSGY